jgi:ketosteroid isomerase-like protein
MESLNWTRRRAAAILTAAGFAAVIATAATPLAAESDEDLARTLIDRFYDDLAPNSTELKAFMGEGFQIIGSDGLSFDRKTYPGFAKEVTSFAIEDLVVRRDGAVLTATYNVTYAGAFEGVAREVPHLARLAVFQETAPGEWKIQALAALGTGENDVSGVAPGVLAAWLAATASGDADRVKALAAPDFQMQRADGQGVSLAGYLSGLEPGPSATVEDLVATSFSNTMVVRYNFGAGGAETQPRLTVFQRIGGKWLVSAEAVFPPAGG